MMIDSTNIAFMVDTLNYESCVQNHEMLKDFKFVAEKLPRFEGPKEREVTYISATWNFIVFFVSDQFKNCFFSSAEMNEFHCLFSL